MSECSFKIHEFIFMSTEPRLHSLGNEIACLRVDYQRRLRRDSTNICASAGLYDAEKSAALAAEGGDKDLSPQLLDPEDLPLVAFASVVPYLSEAYTGCGSES